MNERIYLFLKATMEWAYEQGLANNGLSEEQLEGATHDLMDIIEEVVVVPVQAEEN